MESDISCDCTQAVGYEGDQCEVADGLCGDSSLQCLNDGECLGDTEPPSCKCKLGYLGVTCAQDGKIYGPILNKITVHSCKSNVANVVALVIPEPYLLGN